MEVPTDRVIDGLNVTDALLGDGASPHDYLFFWNGRPSMSSLFTFSFLFHFILSHFILFHFISFYFILFHFISFHFILFYFIFVLFVHILFLEEYYLCAVRGGSYKVYIHKHIIISFQYFYLFVRVIFTF